MGRKDTDWHNEGQKDGSDNDYNPPHDNPRDNTFGTYTDKEIEDRKEYNEGFKHGGKNK